MYGIPFNPTLNKQFLKKKSKILFNKLKLVRNQRIFKVN